MKRLLRKADNKMNIVYALEDFPKQVTKTIFLAGPTPRDNAVASWRPDAIKQLEQLGYDGTVFIPEPRDNKWAKDYTAQVDWERKCLDAADCIVFWIPRELETMPAFTTNTEFGLYCKSGKVVAGAPEDAPKNTYLIDLATKENIPWSKSLEETLKSALTIIGQGAERKDGECLVPQLVWNHETFQNWYQAQKAVGNVLQNAQVKYVFIMPKAKLLFLWICHVEVFIKSENRVKSNEFVLSRTDISSVVMYYPGSTLMDAKIVLVKEFRSPVVNSEEFVYEVPGGSSNSKKPPLQVAASEVEEEVGFKVDQSRLTDLGIRQAAATLSAHRIQAYGLRLTEDELKQIEDTVGEVHGVEEDTERTYTEIKTLGEIIDSNLLDWNNIGMIMIAIGGFKNAK